MDNKDIIQWYAKNHWGKNMAENSELLQQIISIFNN
jgi:hypothetical protein